MVAEEQLRSFMERVERLEEEKKALAADIREVFSEAKSQGFDTKIIKSVLKLRAMDPSDRAEQDEMIELYRKAAGIPAQGELNV